MTYEKACSYSRQAPKCLCLDILGHHFPHLSLFKILPAFVGEAAPLLYLCGAGFLVHKLNETSFSVSASSDLY